MGLGSGIRDPGSEIRDPRSGIRKKTIPDPEKNHSGSRIQGSKRHWILSTKDKVLHKNRYEEQTYFSGLRVSGGSRSKLSSCCDEFRSRTRRSLRGMNRRRRRTTGGALSGSTSSAELSLVSKKILKVSLVCLSVLRVQIRIRIKEHRILETGLRIRINFIRIQIRIQHFKLNTDFDTAPTLQ